jgi:group I intron endonuclease
MTTKSGIYKITNVLNGRIYIGSAVNISQRKSVHFYDLRKNQHSSQKLQRSFNKHGESVFVFDIIEGVENVEHLIDREQFYLNTLLFADILDNRFQTLGYNCNRVAGNTLGYRHTEQWKKEASNSRQGPNNGNYGRTLSNESKLKISRCNSGKIPSLETRCKMANARKTYLEKYGHPCKGVKRGKGKPLSEEHKEKLRIFRTGKKHSPETKIKMSNAHKSKKHE